MRSDAEADAARAVAEEFAVQMILAMRASYENYERTQGGYFVNGERQPMPQWMEDLLAAPAADTAQGEALTD